MKTVHCHGTPYEVSTWIIYLSIDRTSWDFVLNINQYISLDTHTELAQWKWFNGVSRSIKRCSPIRANSSGLLYAQSQKTGRGRWSESGHSTTARYRVSWSTWLAFAVTKKRRHCGWFSDATDWHCDPQYPYGNCVWDVQRWVHESVLENRQIFLFGTELGCESFLDPNGCSRLLMLR